MRTFSIPKRTPSAPASLMPTQPPGQLIATYQISPGDVIFIAGPNGVGKSSLIHIIGRALGPAPAAEIFSGHRQIHFTSDDTEQTGMSLEQLQIQLFQHNQHANRYRSAWGEQHLKSVVRRILNKQNQDNDDIVNIASSTGRPVSDIERENPRVISVINRIFSDSDLAVKIALKDGVLKASRDGDTFYGIDRLSDGERAALLIVGAVLVRPRGGVIAIDEPEKHLNPLISSALIARVIRARPDLSYVIASHDLSLIEATKPKEIIYVRNSEVLSSDVNHENRVFDVYVLPGSSDVPEDVRRSVLGSRKSLLFVEGNHSTDQLLYKSIYERHSVVSRGGWEAVVQSVRSLDASPTFHWVSPAGLIDRDGREASEVGSLEAEKIFSLPVPSIENLYFHPSVVRIMADQIGFLYGGDTATRFLAASAAAKAALDAARKDVEARMVVWRLNRAISATKPSVKSVKSGLKKISGVDVEPIRASVEDDLKKMIDDDKPFRSVYRTPIKNTGIPSSVCKALGYPSFDEYRAAIISAVERRTPSGIKIRRILTDALPTID